ncbi:MAG: polyphosphate kinase 2 [Acidithiobacillales bacterium SM1_46]|jgi:polyphosphate:AMP phosphotransferase|nr:MAG: polyphosphate kinase 2 [Acidithiobacillales bacterium SM1_46]
MLESAEVGHTIDKATFERELPALREDLLGAQYELLEKARFPAMLLVNGLDASGRGETVNALKEWMDPRHLRVHALVEPSQEERERPEAWRFWRALPPKGRIGIFFGNWYTLPLIARVRGELRAAELDQHLDEILRFERMLADEGALILKFWFHLPRKQQKKRLEKLEADPATRWRVTKRDWAHYRLYRQFRDVAERTLRQTSTAHAPWIVVEGTDRYYRNLSVGKTLLGALRHRLAEPETPGPATEPPLPERIDQHNIIARLDLSQKLDKAKYEKQLPEYQGRLARLTRKKRFRDHSVIALFEGVDAAGKGGAIRRVANALDIRHYDIYPIAAPTDEERAQPYLWRFWRHVPARGRIAIFDRSWYGRVLVERVDNLCTEHDWMRAYSEINDFEEQLVRAGAIVLKFWLQISPEEQLRRFKEREATAHKRFKITPEDWRNREKRPLYERAVLDMVDRTSTEIAPWQLISAEDKRYARIEVLKTLCERIETAI